jgi:hypothetical protein
VGPARQREERKKKKETTAWAAAGRWNVGCWAAGPKGKRGKFSFFFFFFKLFSNQPFRFKFKSNLFKLFT